MGNLSSIGHSFIKAKMAEHNAMFGGEHSGHFYFRDFWFADSGMLAALHVLAALGASPQPLSQLLAEYSRYVASGEINSTVTDQAAATAQVKATFAGRPGVSTDELDGLTVSAAAWWFNLRPSNTEPLLRLNAEAGTGAAMAAIRDEVLGLVRGSTDRSGNAGPGDSASPGDTVFPGETPDPGGRNPRGQDEPGIAEGNLMQIDGWLLDILACPNCHAPLRVDEEASELVCTSATCGLAYPVRDDIPVLLVEEARRPGEST